MSRVAKAPITLPSQVSLEVGVRQVMVKGPKGSLTNHMNHLVEIKQETVEGSQVITFSPRSKDPKAWAQAGTTRAIVNNMVKGVTQGFSITLELVGVGYRAQGSKHHVALSLGYSHPVEFKLPAGVTVETPNNTTVILTGIDKQLLGQVASEIRAIRSPEPYKGKGVRYLGEIIIKKEAKKK